MHDLRTDDLGRFNEYMYRGPADLPFMWRARLSTQLYTLMLTFALWAVLATVIPTVLFEPVPYVPAPLAKGAFVLALGAMVGVGTAMVVGPQITKRNPVMYWVEVWSAELNAPRPAMRVRRPAPPAWVPTSLWKPPPPEPADTIDPSVITGK